MPRPALILPRADAACGKIFFSDRRMADDHRIGLEVWYRATGRAREGYRLSVYRCRRCGGFHIGRRPIDRIPIRRPTTIDHDPDRDDRDSFDGQETGIPHVRRTASYEPAWA